MTRAQLNRYVRTLESRRKEVSLEISERRQRLFLVPDSDPMDLTCGVEECDLAVGDLDRLTGTLRDLDRALGKIQEGTFGVCDECRGAIPPKRLDAAPWSPYCVVCQERAEQAGPKSAVDEYAYAVAN